MKRRFIEAAAAMLAACAVNVAGAGVVSWPALGLDEAQITGGGQLFEGFAGMPCLSVVMAGSSNVDEPYIHPTLQLWYRSDEGAQGERPPAIITLEFDRIVVLTATIDYFGDGDVREQIGFSSALGSFEATAAAGQTVSGNGTGELLILSSDGVSPFSTVVLGTGVRTVTLTLDGADENDLAGVTLALEITSVAVTPDIDGSGVVDGADLGALLGLWGPCGSGCCDADFDLNGEVDGADLGQLLGAWGSVG